MAEFSPLKVSAWIKRLGPSFKDSLIPLSLSCIFPYHQSKWMNLSTIGKDSTDLAHDLLGISLAVV